MTSANRLQQQRHHRVWSAASRVWRLLAGQEEQRMRAGRLLRVQRHLPGVSTAGMRRW